MFGNFLLTGLTRVVSGYWSLSDPQSGYTAISREALDTVDLEACYEAYGFLNDLLTRLNAHGFEMRNVEIPAHYGDEESGIRYSSFIPRVSILLCRLLLLRVLVWRLQTRSSSSERAALGDTVATHRSSDVVGDSPRPAIARDDHIADGGDERSARRERI
jgi:hypothetical protein